MYTTVCRDGIEFEVKITDEEILIYSDEELTNVLGNSLLESIRQEAIEFKRDYKEDI